MTGPLPRTTALRQSDTARLVPSRFAAREDSVLAGIAEDDAHLEDLFELDAATNDRLRAQCGLLPGIGIDELVFGVPNWRLVNAAFTHPRPEGSRFNGPDRGAWYCSFDVETALAEVAFHKSVEYAEIARFEDTVTYEELFADFSGEFHDLRGDARSARCLDPASYVASQKLAERLLNDGALGVVYESVRRSAGTNLACFRPAAVGNVRRGGAWRFTWSGGPEPAIAAAPVSGTGPSRRARRSKRS